MLCINYLTRYWELYTEHERQNKKTDGIQTFKNHICCFLISFDYTLGKGKIYSTLALKTNNNNKKNKLEKQMQEKQPQSTKKSSKENCKVRFLGI